MSQLKIIKNRNTIFDEEIKLSSFSPIHFYKEGDDFHLFFIDFKQTPDLIISKEELNGDGFIDYILENFTCYINKQECSLLSIYNEQYTDNGLTIIDKSDNTVFSSKNDKEDVFNYHNYDNNVLNVCFGNSSKIAFKIDIDSTKREIENEINNRYIIYRNGISTTSFAPIIFEPKISSKANQIIEKILDNIDVMSEELSQIELEELQKKTSLSISKKIEGSIEK